MRPSPCLLSLALEKALSRRYRHFSHSPPALGSAATAHSARLSAFERWSPLARLIGRTSVPATRLIRLVCARSLRAQGLYRPPPRRYYSRYLQSPRRVHCRHLEPPSESASSCVIQLQSSLPIKPTPVKRHKLLIYINDWRYPEQTRTSPATSGTCWPPSGQARRWHRPPVPTQATRHGYHWPARGTLAALQCAGTAMRRVSSPRSDHKKTGFAHRLPPPVSGLCWLAQTAVRDGGTALSAVAAHRPGSHRSRRSGAARCRRVCAPSRIDWARDIHARFAARQKKCTPPPSPALVYSPLNQ